MRASESTALVVAACLFLMLGSRRIAVLLLGTVARALERLSPARLLSVSWMLRVMVGVEWKFVEGILRANAHRALGQMERAVEATRGVVAALGLKECPWGVVNLAVDIYVSAGRYREALRVQRRWPREARRRGKARDPVAFTLTRINQAEALHNLGRDDRALARLDRAEPLARKNALAISGLRCLRAWILTHRGELERAREELGRVDEGALPGYRAEVRYTWAALERESGHLERAREHAQAGLEHARRPSSVRNGKFLLAGILALLGDAQGAEAHFSDAIASEHRTQGGDGLWRYAAFLDAQGNSAAAARALALLVERDPESVYAARAASRLPSSRS